MKPPVAPLQTQSQSQTQSADPAPAAGPLLGYERRQGALADLYDEFLTDDGSIRSHWKEVSDYFVKLGPEEITKRWNQARKILRDNGVAYNASVNDADGPGRAWELNPIPLRLPSGEWPLIEKAVRQRGRLLNNLLNDLYGEQKTLKEGLVPPALVFGNSAYLRPCTGIPVSQSARLVLYAVDLARSPDGEWWVLSDSTQAPSGAGYALENRVVSSRVFPEIFHSVQIAKLGGYFRQMKQALEALTPRPGVAPNVVLLTPGRLNETYFEQAYLARQLDFTLVEGQDLMVRNSVVYIRTLQGLQRVDVIMRRVDDDYCDPLELRDESLLGVPGLLNAVRAGTVTLANSLGSGLVQSPALAAFLPKLCQRLLGETLLMPSVATWWCGQPAEQSYVLENLHGLEVKPAFRFPGDKPAKGAAKDLVRDAIRRRPEYFTAQEFVSLSQCPDFIEGGSKPYSVVLRVFAVRSGDDYIVMPGGLTRVAQDESSHGILMRSDGGTKDTWVDPADVSTTGDLGAARPEEKDSRRAVLGLTSRVADNLFWLGRYAERSEFTARMVRAVQEGLLNQQGMMEISDFQPVLKTLKHFGQFEEAEFDGTNLGLEEELIGQMLDPANPGGLHTILRRLRGVVTSVRDQVTADTWRIVNQLPDLLPQPGSVGVELDLNDVILHLSALDGVLNENMTHGSGWRFMELGRRLERSTYSSRVVTESLMSPKIGTSNIFEVLLGVFDAGITYRQKYLTIRRAAVLDLLLCDESNPRSLASQLKCLFDEIMALPRESEEQFKLAEERLLLRVLSDVRLLDARHPDPGILESVEDAMLGLSAQITQRFFTHLRTSALGGEIVTGTLADTV